MKLPPKKVKHIEKRVVDGVEQQVEFEEVCKKLFLFADTVVRRKRKNPASLLVIITRFPHPRRHLPTC
ncbi:hypothetical protein PC9H_010288 [Pleurotus ostreatus]|uniref:Uncharacterized protein n=1 Tax=Pleurotus ostreatus TaxID=5322 RepID=A0A8H7DQE4_PLEOS|nr:uncharacterized protein PC9H_010288 [Pleurotus ostreatus]KAF7424977.1 hypothetical protein PC9H_010288 [Pleurotus ostreatus]